MNCHSSTSTASSGPKTPTAPTRQSRNWTRASNSTALATNLKVKPALVLLTAPEYKGAQAEFLAAHDHYRHGREKEAITECLKSLESAMKAICARRQWKHAPMQRVRPSSKCSSTTAWFHLFGTSISRRCEVPWRLGCPPRETGWVATVKAFRSCRSPGISLRTCFTSLRRDRVPCRFREGLAPRTPMKLLMDWRPRDADRLSYLWGLRPGIVQECGLPRDRGARRLPLRANGGFRRQRPNAACPLH